MFFVQNPRVTFPIGVGLVSCMMFVAWSDSSHGKALSETHMITSVGLSNGTLTLSGMSTVTALSGVPSSGNYFSNAIHDAEYRAPGATKNLHNDGIAIRGFFSPQPRS
jgi:hypothetical protein